MPRAQPREPSPSSVQWKELSARPDVLVSRIAARDWGVLSLEELHDCGLTDKAVWWRTRNGRLHGLHRGVYAVGHPNVPVEGRWLAAVKACGEGAVLSHYSAAALWGLVEWDGRWPQVTIPAGSRREHRGIRVHESARLEPQDVTRRARIPLTSPARTLLDLAATLGKRPLRRAVRQALALNRVDVRLLADVLARHRGRRGAARLARIVAAAAPTRSELEDVVLDLIVRGGLQRPDVNVPLRLEGRVVIPDFRWPEQRLVVEADSRTWHDNPIARHDDAERQALLERHGERVARVTWRQAVVRPAETLARLRGAGAP